MSPRTRSAAASRMRSAGSPNVLRLTRRRSAARSAPRTGRASALRARHARGHRADRHGGRGHASAPATRRRRGAAIRTPAAVGSRSRPRRRRASGPRSPASCARSTSRTASPWGDLAVVVRSGAARTRHRAGARARRGADAHAAAGGVALREDSAARALLVARRGRHRPGRAHAGARRRAAARAVRRARSARPAPAAARAARTRSVAGGGSRASDELLVEALRSAGGARHHRHSGRHRAAATRRRPSTSCAQSRRRRRRGAALARVGAQRRRRPRGARRRSARASRPPRRTATSTAWSRCSRGQALRRARARRCGARRLPRRAARRRGAGRHRSRRAAATTPCSSTTPSGVVGPRVRHRRRRRAAGRRLAQPAPARLAARAAASSCACVTGRRRAARIDERTARARRRAAACSRSPSRGPATGVVLAAVVNDDETGSVLVLPAAAPTRPRSTPHVVAAHPARRHRAAAAHADRAGATPSSARRRRGIRRSPARRPRVARCADPTTGTGSSTPSTTGRSSTDEPVPISPSQLEKLRGVAARLVPRARSPAPTSSTAMNVGTILHWAMETADRSRRPTRSGPRSSRAGTSSSFESPWLAEHQRRATRGSRTALAEYLRRLRVRGQGAGRGRGTVRVPARRRWRAATRACDRARLDRPGRARSDGSVVIVDLKTGSADHRAADGRRAIRSSPSTSSPTREGLLDEFLAEHGDHTGGRREAALRQDGHRRQGVPRGHPGARSTTTGLEAFRDRIRQAAIGMAAAGFSGARRGRQLRRSALPLGCGCIASRTVSVTDRP